ncbi:YycH family regulatory protein [Lihuaxuella thermophila]|uniref:Two-component signal transduction system YycFG, regulatory protein YycH n=1 Tax=Lihuaxuella thermophila TaxID=1173111 RepID=A0A1H8BHF3_9BACL|nr:two-component system activity regulator YycH [Lihuaxuella thermophila]SEM82176.1 Two-component signal transduction system YycFG, regulatory protein YycH [Lihuaxuella thermophila]
MKEKWIEHIKSVILIMLVVLSFVLTGFLWYSSPPYEEKNETVFVPPYPFSDKKYNSKEIYQLVSPYQIIIHHGGRHRWIRPESKMYRDLLNEARQADFDAVTGVEPSPDLWNRLFNQVPGIELQFSRDVSASRLDAFFDESLRQQPLLNRLENISRIWLYSEPETKQTRIWFISDKEQEIVQAEVQLKNDNLDSLVAQAASEKGPSLTAIPADGKVPWDPANQSQSFSRVFYLPDQPLAMNRSIYKTKEIKVTEMNQWLSRNPSVNPIILNNNEEMYMYDEDESLTYNKQGNFMIYNDTNNQAEGTYLSVTDEIGNINHFVQDHRGWTGNYLLDEIKVSEEDDAHQYIFRLIVQGYPVYWEDQKTIRPDTIELQTGYQGSVSKYIRSMLYLTGQPDQTEIKLKPWLQVLASKKIPLQTVEHIFPGYRARLTGNKEKQVILDPAWVVILNNGKTTMISSP